MRLQSFLNLTVHNLVMLTLFYFLREGSIYLIWYSVNHKCFLNTYLAGFSGVVQTNSVLARPWQCYLDIALLEGIWGDNWEVHEVYQKETQTGFLSNQKKCIRKHCSAIPLFLMLFYYRILGILVAKRGTTAWKTAPENTLKGNLWSSSSKTQKAFSFLHLENVLVFQLLK